MAWYVVFRGRTSGVYRDWASCNDQVCGFRGCSFRSYPSEEQALAAYHSYFGKAGSTGSDAGWGHEAALGTQLLLAAAEADVQGHAALESLAGDADLQADPPVAAEPDMMVLLVLLIALLLALTAYFMN